MALFSIANISLQYVKRQINFIQLLSRNYSKLYSPGVLASTKFVLSNNYTDDPFHKLIFMQPLRFCHSNNESPLFHDQEVIMKEKESESAVLEKYIKSFKIRPNMKSRIKISPKRIRQAIDCLKNISLKDDEIIEILSKNPSILYCDKDYLLYLFTDLNGIGCTSENIREFCLRYKNINKVKTKQIIATLEVLRSCSFSEEDARKIICSCPDVLSLQQKAIDYRLNLLISYFPKQALLKFAAGCPPILIDAWESVNSRIEYITNRMGLPYISILSAPDFFYYSLEHIQTRHILLHRVGLYVKPDKYNFTPDYVPKLQKIIQTDDEYFCARVANISLDELIAFKQILEVEKEMSTELDASDDEMDSQEAHDSYRKRSR